jgi:glycerol-3-phosphate O-acyltransferase/dihydroxyacetone phosphate acyltransferase
MTVLARLLVRVFFRRVELEGAAQLPASGPVVLVANHTNGLVDGLLLMATLSRPPRLLGKATLFKVPVLWPFLKLAGVIPVFRTMDGDAGDHNVSAFATSRAVLRDGGMVSVFPEGISHDEPARQPLRTGAARIALEAMAEGDAEGLVLVAVGLVYDAKARFRSRALVRVGTPVVVARWADAFRRDERATVRAVTDELAAQLDRVSPSFASWTQAERLSRLAALVVRVQGGPGAASAGRRVAGAGLADQVAVAARLAVLEGVSPASVRVLTAACATYDHDLDVVGLDDAQLVAGGGSGWARLALLVALGKVVVALPLAAVGFVVHVVPFSIVKQVAKRPTNEGIKGTVKLLGCFVLFALTYTALAVFVGRAYGVWAGLVAAVGAPLCGYVTLRLRERVQRIGGVLEGLRGMRRRPDVVRALRAERAALVGATRAALGS